MMNTISGVTLTLNGSLSVPVSTARLGGDFPCPLTSATDGRYGGDLLISAANDVSPIPSRSLSRPATARDTELREFEEALAASLAPPMRKSPLVSENLTSPDDDASERADIVGTPVADVGADAIADPIAAAAAGTTTTTAAGDAAVGDADDTTIHVGGGTAEDADLPLVPVGGGAVGGADEDGDSDDDSDADSESMSFAQLIGRKGTPSAGGGDAADNGVGGVGSVPSGSDVVGVGAGNDSAERADGEAGGVREGPSGGGVASSGAGVGGGGGGGTDTMASGGAGGGPARRQSAASMASTSSTAPGGGAAASSAEEGVASKATITAATPAALSGEQRSATGAEVAAGAVAPAPGGVRGGGGGAPSATIVGGVQASETAAGPPHAAVTHRPSGVGEGVGGTVEGSSTAAAPVRHVEKQAGSDAVSNCSSPVRQRPLAVLAVAAARDGVYRPAIALVAAVGARCSPGSLTAPAEGSNAGVGAGARSGRASESDAYGDTFSRSSGRAEQPPSLGALALRRSLGTAADRPAVREVEREVLPPVPPLMMMGREAIMSKARAGHLATSPAGSPHRLGSHNGSGINAMSSLRSMRMAHVQPAYSAIGAPPDGRSYGPLVSVAFGAGDRVRERKVPVLLPRVDGVRHVGR